MKLRHLGFLPLIIIYILSTYEVVTIGLNSISAWVPIWVLLTLFICVVGIIWALLGDD